MQWEWKRSWKILAVEAKIIFFWNWIHPLLCYQSLDGDSGIYNIQVVLRQLPRHIWMLKFSHETFGHHVWNLIFAITRLGARIHWWASSPDPSAAPPVLTMIFRALPLIFIFRVSFYSCCSCAAIWKWYEMIPRTQDAAPWTGTSHGAFSNNKCGGFRPHVRLGRFQAGMNATQAIQLGSGEHL